MKRSFSKLYSFLSRSSNISLLIDGQNDQIGNWNFTLQKIFHNTYIIRHKISVIINIIGSSGLYSQPKIFSCPNIFPFILYFRCDLSESKVPKRKIWNLANSCQKELNAAMETTMKIDDDECEDERFYLTMRSLLIIANWPLLRLIPIIEISTI